MSVPARRLPERDPHGVDPARPPRPRREPVRTPSAQPPARSPRPSTSTPRRRRRRAHLGFTIFTGLVATALIVGVVTLNALLAQAAFQMRSAQDHLQTLQRESIRLTDESARRSSPAVIATWARRHDMVTPAPGEVHILRVPGSGR